MQFQLIRSATIKLLYGDNVILIDPYLAPKFSRPPYSGKSRTPMVELPFKIEEIYKNISLVIISHMHSDHFDEIAKKTLPKKTKIFCQPCDIQVLKDLGFYNTLVLDNEVEFNGIYIKRFEVQHGTGEVLLEMGATSGFIFKKKDEPTVLWIGDSILTGDIRKTINQSDPDVIIIHSCGATWGNNIKIIMDEIQTIEVCKISTKGTVIATHMDTVDHATVDRVSLRKYADLMGIDHNKLLIPQDGEILKIERK